MVDVASGFGCAAVAVVCALLGDGEACRRWLLLLLVAAWGWRLAWHIAREPALTAVQQIPGIGPILGAVFVAEVGDITRFGTAAQLACLAGLTPRHHESDTHVHRGRITKQGSRLVRWAAVESVKLLPGHTRIGAIRERVAARLGANIGAGRTPKQAS